MKSGSTWYAVMDGSHRWYATLRIGNVQSCKFVFIICDVKLSELQTATSAFFSQNMPTSKPYLGCSGCLFLMQGQRLYQYTDPTGKQYLSALPPAAGGPPQPRTPFFYTPMVVEEGMLSPHAGGTPPSEAMRRQSIDKARVSLPATPEVALTLLLRCCTWLLFNIFKPGSVTAARHWFL